MKYLVSILAVSLLALGVLVYYQGRSAERAKNNRENENRLHQQRVSQIQATLQATKDSVRREKADRHKTDSLFKVSDDARKREIKANDKKLSERREIVQHLIDSVSELRSFVAAYDSSLADRDTLIAMLTQNNQSISESYEREIALLNNQVSNLQSGHLEDHRTIEDLQKSLAKAEKKANKRLGFGINGGYGIQEHGGAITAGPAITAGIHWTLFKL